MNRIRYVVLKAAISNIAEWDFTAWTVARCEPIGGRIEVKFIRKNGEPDTYDCADPSFHFKSMREAMQLLKKYVPAVKKSNKIYEGESRFVFYVQEN